MYTPTDANADGGDPISYSSQLFLYRPFTSEITPNSQENTAPPFPVFDFNVPFEDHDDLFYHDLFFHHQPLAEQAADQASIASGIQISNRVHSMDQHVRVTCTGEEDQQKQHQNPPRKRTSKRDRHTKIDTAQGPRDRRMRLSLEVARKFFGLQDMLSFDKPSRTIEWLLNQAKYEIKRLQRETNFPVGCNAGCSPSESEVVSGLDEVTASDSNDKQAEAKPAAKPRKSRQSRKSVSHPRTKEIRERARARARERTKEKNMRSQKFAQEEDSGHCNEATNHNHKSSIFGEEEHSQCHYSTNGLLDLMSKAQAQNFQIKEQSGIFHVDQCSMTTSKWNLPFSFQYPDNPQTAQFAALQFLDKKWETCDNHNNLR